MLDMILDPIPRPKRLLHFVLFDLHVRLECDDVAMQALLAANFGAMVSGYADMPVDLSYSIRSRPSSFSLSRERQPPLDATDACDLLYLLDKDIAVELQKRRPDLLFLHSAALDWQGAACLLVAESGAGKSTTTWGLLHHGFRYLTDELSAVALESMQVFPFSRALVLKQPPPAYPLPEDTIHLTHTIRVPARFFPGAAIVEPRPLRSIFLLKYCPDLEAPLLRLVGPTEASARLYLCALNALAHDGHGLDAVIRIARQVPCYSVISSELRATCRLIRSVFSVLE